MSQWADLPVEILPAILRDFVRLIGLPATMRIVEHFGGVRLYIPINPHPDHHLAKLIGLDNLVKLSKVYGLQDHFDIPRATHALRQLRNQKIRSEYGPKSARTLALENNLTERSVWAIVGKRMDANPDQNSLFG